MRRASRVRAVLLAGSLVLLVGCQDQAPAVPVAAAYTTTLPATPHQAAPASRFVDSIGVNTHLNYTNTPYGDEQAVQRALRSLGVHHIRDGLPAKPAPGFFDALRSLHADGVGTDLVLGSTGRRQGQPLIPLDASLAQLRQADIAPALDSIEGPNEWDHRGGATWAAQVRRYQQELYAAVRADPAFAAVPVVGPSVARRGRRTELGDLSAYLDFGNNHTYLLTGPTTAEIGGERHRAGIVSKTKPVVATETGYTNAVNDSSGKPPMSEAVTSVYLPRLFADFFAAGVRRTYVYELVDEHPDAHLGTSEANFGLLYNDKRPKPAYVALQRLIGILADSQPIDAQPASFSYSVSGPADRHALALHKSDGSFVLLLWRDVGLTRTGDGIDATAQPLTVHLGAPARVDVRRPSLSAGTLHTLQGVSTVTGKVGADLVALTITPPAAGSPTSQVADAFATTAKPATGRTPGKAAPSAPARSASRFGWLLLLAGAALLLVVGGVVLAVIARRRGAVAGRHPD